MCNVGRAADAVIVGAGIVGASIAWALTRGSPLKVVVLERDGPASGATGRSGALVRMHYTNDPEAALAIKSFEVFENWSELVGGACGLTRTGFLRVVSRQNETRLRRVVERLQHLGARTHLVSAADVREIFPQCWTEDFEVAAYEPESG